MPKVTWLTAPIPPDHIQDLIKRYMIGRKLTYEKIAPEVGLSLDGAKQKKNRGGGKYTVDDLRKWSKALDIPPEEVGAAVIEDIKAR